MTSIYRKRMYLKNALSQKRETSNKHVYRILLHVCIFFCRGSYINKRFFFNPKLCKIQCKLHTWARIRILLLKKVTYEYLTILLPDNYTQNIHTIYRTQDLCFHKLLTVLHYSKGIGGRYQVHCIYPPNTFFVKF